MTDDTVGSEEVGAEEVGDGQCAGRYRDCSPDELGETIGQLHGLMSAVHRSLLEVVAAFDQARAWKVDGACSGAEWLMGTLGVAFTTAGTWVRTARALEHRPAMANAFADGRLSFDKVVALSRVTDPADDERATAEAIGLSAAQVRLAARRKRPPDDASAAEAHRRRSLRLRYDDEDNLHLFGRLPGVQGSVVAKAIERIADNAAPDASCGMYEDYASRCADALVQLASMSLGADGDPDRACVVIHAPAQALFGSGAGSAGSAGDHSDKPEAPPAEAAATSDGVVVGFDALRRLACDSRIEWIVEAGDGSTLGVGRATRSVPAWLNRLLRRRDGGCRFPLCDHRRWAHAHHIAFWSEGGATNSGNLLLLCPNHHRLVHEGHWRIEGDPNGRITFVRPDGRALPHAPPRLRSDLRDRYLSGDEGAA